MLLSINLADFAKIRNLPKRLMLNKKYSLTDKIENMPARGILQMTLILLGTLIPLKIYGRFTTITFTMTEFHYIKLRSNLAFDFCCK